MKAVIQRLANNVMSSLGKGHREAIYHRALETAFNHEGIHYRTRVDCPIFFLGDCVGVGQADLIVDDLIIELKVVSRIPAGVSDQIRKYVGSLLQTEKKQYHGILLNFNPISGKVDMVVEGGIPRAPSHKRRETPSPLKRSRSPPHRRSPSPTTPIHKRVVISRYFGMETRSAAGSQASSRSPSPTGSVLWSHRGTRSKSFAF